MALFFFFFNDTATTEIYTLSLHDALPISWAPAGPGPQPGRAQGRTGRQGARRLPGAGRVEGGVGHGGPCTRCQRDRKSTRLNSSHSQISYAVFCLKKKKKKVTSRHIRNAR